MSELFGNWFSNIGWVKLQDKEKIIWEWKYEKSDFIHEINNKYKLYLKNISIPNIEYKWTELGYWDVDWYILIK